MVLIDKCLIRRAIQEVHVLRNRVFGLLFLALRNQLVDIFDPKHLTHLTVKFFLVIYLRRIRRHLHNCLHLNDFLRHSRRIRVRYRDNFYVVVVVFAGLAVAFFRVKVVLFRGIITNNRGQQLKFLLHRVVDTRLHCRHNLQRAFKNSQSRTHRGLCRHIRDLHISRTSKATAFFDNLVHQRHKNLAGFFVRQGHDVVPDGAAGHIHISKLGRSNRGVVAFNTQATGLEAAGEVRQSACIHQLTNQHGARLGVSANKVD